jgi:hypothetical protein
VLLQIDCGQEHLFANITVMRLQAMDKDKLTIMRFQFVFSQVPFM